MFDNVRGHTFLARCLPPVPVIFDLGANLGEFSKLMSERFGGSYYLAEANPALAAALLKQGNFHVWPCAVADRDGTLDFYVAEHSESSSALPPPTTGTTPNVPVSVTARSIESLIREASLSHLDLIKLDIEGMEAPALLSIPAELLQKIGQITVEFHCDAQFGRAPRAEVQKAIRYLRSQGFIALNFSGTTLTDVLFINRRLHRISYWKGRLWEMAGARPLWLRQIKQYVPETLRRKMNKMVDKLAGRKAQ